MLYETTYNYAGFSINAAQDDEGNYWISQRTIGNILEKPRFQSAHFLAKKSTKAILGNDFSLHKISDNSNKNKANQTWISIPNFLGIMTVESRKSEKAMAIILAGFTTDFYSALKSHFGEVMDEEQKEYLRELVFNRLANFKAWTDVIRDRYLSLTGEKPKSDYYKTCVKHVNMELFGVTHFKNDRNNMTEMQQTTITKFEELLVAMSKKHPTASPKRLITKSLEVYNLIY